LLLESLDLSIRRRRTKKEAKALNLMEEIGIMAPKLIKSDERNFVIEMSYIENSKTVKEFFEKLSPVNDKEAAIKLFRKLGALLSKMHMKSFCHGDLTGSNILIVPSTSDSDEYDLALIDFGLCTFKADIESAAIDLYVLERALAIANSNFGEIFNELVDEYSKESQSNAVAQRLDKVRERGRKKSVIG